MSAAEIIAMVTSVVGASVALYAAVLSRRALAWQQQRDAERLATRIRVQFGHATQMKPFGIRFLDDRDPRPEPIFYEVTAIAVNEGETTEYVAGLKIEQSNRQAGLDLWANGKPDHQLKPRERLPVMFSADSCGLDLSQGFVAIVRLASGEEIESGVERPDETLVQDVRSHNRRART